MTLTSLIGIVCLMLFMIAIDETDSAIGVFCGWFLAHVIRDMEN
jgi:hypothetical protein